MLSTVCRYSAGRYEGYLNNVFSGQATISANLTATTSYNPMHIAEFPGANQQFLGLITEVLVWINQEQTSTKDRINTNINRRYKLY